MNEKTQKDYVIKHLEMIQGVVNRLGHDSFLVKGWSMAILAAGMIFIARNETQSGWIVLTFLIPVIGFWILDGYFLWKERLFIQIYNEVRMQEVTDFLMEHKGKPECSWASSIFSVTLSIFYVIEIAFVSGVFLVLKCFSGGS